jgi:hypothetical protein
LPIPGNFGLAEEQVVRGVLSTMTSSEYIAAPCWRENTHDPCPGGVSLMTAEASPPNMAAALPRVSHGHTGSARNSLVKRRTNDRRNKRQYFIFLMPLYLRLC